MTLINSSRIPQVNCFDFTPHIISLILDQDALEHCCAAKCCVGKFNPEAAQRRKVACITVWTALWRLTIQAEMKRVRDRGDAAQRHDPEMAEPNYLRERDTGGENKNGSRCRHSGPWPVLSPEASHLHPPGVSSCSPLHKHNPRRLEAPP